MIGTPVIGDALFDFQAGGSVSFSGSDAPSLELAVNTYLTDRLNNLVTPENYAIRDFQCSGAGDGGVWLCQLMLVDTGLLVAAGVPGECPLGNETTHAQAVFTQATMPGGAIGAAPPAAPPDPQVTLGLNETQRQKIMSLTDPAINSATEYYFLSTAGCGRGRKFLSGLLGLFTPAVG